MHMSHMQDQGRKHLMQRMRGGGWGKAKPYGSQIYESTETHQIRGSCFINMAEWTDRGEKQQPWVSLEPASVLGPAIPAPGILGDPCWSPHFPGWNQGGLGLISRNQISRTEWVTRLTFTWWIIAASFRMAFSQLYEVFLWVWLYQQAQCFQNKVNNQL